MEGYYIRVASTQNMAVAKAAVAQAWRKYLGTYLANGACPSAQEMMFFSAIKGEPGAGIFFPQRPPGWDAMMQQEPQWRLIDGSSQPVTKSVCFFPADEGRRPPGW